MSDEDESVTCQVPSEPPSPKESKEGVLPSLKKRLEVLVNDEKVEKNTALNITRLFHEFETYMLAEFKTKDELCIEMCNKLEKERLQHELDRMARRQTLEDMQTQHQCDTPAKRRR